jgi:hypothetical protein
MTIPPPDPFPDPPPKPDLPVNTTPSFEEDPDLLPVHEEVPPPPPKEMVDNKEAEAALNFLNAGIPLQDGTPDNPVAVLAQLRKQK